MGKKEDGSPKADSASEELSKDLEDIDENAVIDEIPDDVLLNEPLDDDDLRVDLDMITNGKQSKKNLKKSQQTSFLQQGTKKASEVSHSSALDDLDADDEILTEMEGILSGKAPTQPSTRTKTKSSSGRVLHTSLYTQIIHAMLFLDLCLIGGYYIPLSLTIEASGGKYMFLALLGVIGVIIIAGGILYFRLPRLAVLLSFIGALWTGFGWTILYFWLGLTYIYGWWAFPLLCVVINGILVYFTIQCVLHDRSFEE